MSEVWIFLVILGAQGVTGIGYWTEVNNGFCGATSSNWKMYAKAAHPTDCFRVSLDVAQGLHLTELKTAYLPAEDERKQYGER